MPRPVEEEKDRFVGRELELRRLRAELDRVRGGRPRVVLIGGPPGIGKTALVDRFLQEEGDLQVLWASGEAWEASVAYGLVDQLTRAAGMSKARLLASRERVLPADEPISVGAQLLEMLGELESRGPVVLVLDDAHWSDLDSLRALMFALRRLVADRVLTLLMVRPEDLVRLPEGLRRLAGGRTGESLSLGPLAASEVRRLATALGVGELSVPTAQRLHAHTEGNPLYIRALLTELPAERWRNWQPVLPAPRAFAALVVRRLKACGDLARRLVEAASVLGVHAPLATAAALADVEEPLAALEEAHVVDLLDARDEPGSREVVFPHPLVHAAVYEQLGPGRRTELHLAAAGLVEEQGAALRHRVAAATAPDPRLAEELDGFAERESAAGSWASAASALLEASRLGPLGVQRERRLLTAVDAMVGAGDLVQASTLAQDIVDFPPGAMRDAALGYLAVVRGRAREADKLLSAAWDLCDPVEDPRLAATIAQRRALHGVGRLDGEQVVEWAGRAVELAAPGEPVRAEAQAVLGLGVGWLGRIPEGLALQESALAALPSTVRSALPPRISMAHGWLKMVADDLPGARSELAETAPAALRVGSIRIAVWGYLWLARADFLVGAWDEAVLNAERAVNLLEESGHEWLRPLVRWAAAAVPAARGEWDSADDHVQLASAQSGDYELRIVGACLARAHLAAAHGDAGAVIRAVEPLLDLAPRQALDEPGFWPWHDLYADALVGAGRIDEADVFLAPHEALAADRDRRAAMARLARVRGRIEAARGQAQAAEAAFERGLELLKPLPLPFDTALLELSYGQVFRRHGQRRAAAAQLQAAHERFAALGARPYLERCERELLACGLAPAARRTFDPTQLTPQELAVARLVAAGLSNQRVAGELFVSVKTVQFHLTHIYAKLGVSSRAELIAHLKDEMAADPLPR